MTPPATQGTAAPLRLRLLGAVDVEGTSVDDPHPLLRQSKRAAVLFYMLLEGTDGMVSRGRLVELFWPEGPTERGRAALRQTLRFLRRVLPDGSVVRRGNRGVGVDPALVACDVARFRELTGAGRPVEAMELYRGELLAGFVSDAGEGFDAWVEERREELRDVATEAAWRLAVGAESSGRADEAAFWAKRTLAVSLFDEGCARRVMALLARGGDCAAALDAFGELENRMERDGRSPGAFTRRIAEEVERLRERGRSELAPDPGGRRTGVDRRDGEVGSVEDAERRRAEDRRSRGERRTGVDRRAGG